MTVDSAVAGLDALARRYGLADRARTQLARLLLLLDRETHAPTSARDAARALDVHVADSLVALELATVRAARMIVDIGSGAGFPGIALAAALPSSRVRLVESQVDKCVFLRDAAADAGIQNAEVVRARVEEWRDGLGRHDLAVARAVGPQPAVLEYAAPLLRLGGSLVDWRGKRAGIEEDATERAAGELGMRRLEIRRVAPFEGATDRHLHVFEKTEATPTRFPRRPGMAIKRPIGG
jgi:16S rRNA (guanine527-N7)-methyltransferase